MNEQLNHLIEAHGLSLHITPSCVEILSGLDVLFTYEFSGARITLAGIEYALQSWKQQAFDRWLATELLARRSATGAAKEFSSEA